MALSCLCLVGRAVFYSGDPGDFFRLYRVFFISSNDVRSFYVGSIAPSLPPGSPPRGVVAPPSAFTPSAGPAVGSIVPPPRLGDCLQIVVCRELNELVQWQGCLRYGVIVNQWKYVRTDVLKAVSMLVTTWFLSMSVWKTIVNHRIRAEYVVGAYLAFWRHMQCPWN